MISHLNQYIIDEMTCSYKIVCIFLLCTVMYIFFGIKVISRLIGLLYENIAKMATKFPTFRTTLTVQNKTVVSTPLFYTFLYSVGSGHHTTNYFHPVK